MQPPGPPRFVAVGESVELAPRDPDPTASYRWQLNSAPADSRAACGDEPVITFTPDKPGTYRFELSGPNGTARQTVRAFPNCHREVELTLSVDAVPATVDTVESVSVVGPFNDQLVGLDRPRREDGQYILDVELPPGEHHYGFCFNGDLTQQVHDSVTVPGPGRPRCQLAAATTSEELIVTATATAAPDSDFEDRELGVEFAVDDRDPLDPTAIETEDRTLRVPLSAVPDQLRIHAVAVGERHSIADTVAIQQTADREGTTGSDSQLTISRPNDPPKWAESPTVYEIFVRSFAGETPTTTFQELERRVEYLESLAVDVVWLTPIVASPTDHGYHITDYFSTADDLGSREAFESFVGRCHEADIRVVFDLVINHTSRDHPSFQLHSAGLPAYEDYYNRIPRERDGTGIDWAGEDAPEFYFSWQRIPNLNYDSLAVRAWMLRVVDTWVDVVDGFRCDIAWGVPHGFWMEVASRVPDAFLMWDETIPRDPRSHELAFDLHYDSTLHSTLRAVGRGDEPATAIFDALDDTRWQGFPDSAVHLRYVENHDETRYLEECGECALRAAAAVTFTLPGAPMIYYGQERGMTSQRGPMKWYDGDNALTEFHRSLARLRREEPVLNTGAVEPLSVAVVDFESDGDETENDDGEVGNEDREATDGDETKVDDSEETTGDDKEIADKSEATADDGEETADDGGTGDEAEMAAEKQVIGYARDDGDDRLIVVCNFSAEPQPVDLPTAVGDTDCRTGKPLRKRYDGETWYLLVDSVIVCRPESQTT